MPRPDATRPFLAESRMITVQPKPNAKPVVKPVVKQDTFKLDVLSLPIINAHEFAPHVKLGALAPFDTLLVSETVDVVEAITGYEKKNKYTILTMNGHQLYHVKEESSFLQRCCIGSNRPFSLEIIDGSGEEIIHLSRPYRCGCLCCCLQELNVYSPPGNLIGVISETCNLLSPTYLLYDATLPEAPLFEVKGPFCTCSCVCGDVDFPIFMAGQSKPKSRIGIISKKWGGLMRELLTDSDTFGVSFPMDIEPKYKALFLAACFLIDFKHFERSVNG